MSWGIENFVGEASAFSWGLSPANTNARYLRENILTPSLMRKIARFTERYKLAIKATTNSEAVMPSIQMVSELVSPKKHIQT